MSLYQRIEDAYMGALKQGQIPIRLQLTPASLEALIQDRTLGASWIPSIPDFWDQRVLGMPLEKSAHSNALVFSDGASLALPTNDGE